MKCRHGWIVDVNGFGKCMFCDETKQFPQEKITFRKWEIVRMDMYAREIKHDPESWLSGTLHG
jgi:hypothetical protein